MSYGKLLRQWMSKLIVFATLHMARVCPPGNKNRLIRVGPYPTKIRMELDTLV